ncbi:MAG: AMP-binding protein [Pseudomonadota bacterium]
MDLGANFLATLRRDPGAVAFVDQGIRLTYATWGEQVLRLVAGLRRVGLRHGDRVVCVLKNGAELATLYWACQLSGIVIVPLNWRASGAALGYLVADSDVSAIVLDSSQTEVTEGRRDGLAAVDVAARTAPGWTRFADLLAVDAAPPESQARPDDVSILLYTSGTTGRPKGVARTHRAERAAALGHIAQNGYRRGESILGVMPIHHTMGVKAMIIATMLDGKFCSMPRFDAEAAVEIIAREAVSSLSLVPTIYHDILNAPNFDTAKVASVRVLTYAGAPMAPSLAARLQSAFEPHLFVNQLGSTEIYTYSYNPDAGTSPASVGRAGLSAELRLVRIGAVTGDDLAGPEEQGEIVASMRADDAFSGYWNRPEVDADRIRDGWFFTGDAARLDSRGDLILTGRVDDLIVTGGENVSPIEVEACLCACPGVVEAVVVGVPHPRWGQIVAAGVVATPDLNKDTIDAHCQDYGLMPHQRPRWVFFLSQIPKSPVGKVLRREVLENHAGAMPPL